MAQALAGSFLVVPCGSQLQRSNLMERTDLHAAASRVVGLGVSAPLQKRTSRKSLRRQRDLAVCAAADAAVQASGTEGGSGNWLPVVPLKTLPQGQRRIIQEAGEEVMLLWYRQKVYAIESKSPAEGAYSEGLINARLTQDGCIVCPSTDSTFDLASGAVKEWYPSNAVMRFLTRPLRPMVTYPVKIESGFICIDFGEGQSEVSLSLSDASAPRAIGRTADDVRVEETMMVVDESATGFGFNVTNELVNGRAAMLGFVLLLVQESVTGKGFLAGLGVLERLYKVVPTLPLF